jgi:hypothetical protein
LPVSHQMLGATLGLPASGMTIIIEYLWLLSHITCESEATRCRCMNSIKICEYMLSDTPASVLLTPGRARTNLQPHSHFFGRTTPIMAHHFH